MKRPPDNMDVTADRMLRGKTVYPCARVDVPRFNRHTLREAAAVLHELANALTRYSLNPPGETLSDSTALGMARQSIHATNMRDMLAKGRHGGGRRKAPHPAFSDERFIIAHKNGFLAAMRVDTSDPATKRFWREYRAKGFLLSECVSRAEFDSECEKLKPWPSAEQMFLAGVKP